MYLEQFQWLDAHTHHLPADPGVGAVLNIRFPQVPAVLPGWCSVGIHPWDVKTETWSVNMGEFDHFLALHQCSGAVLAIGEIGLDALKGPSLEVQEAAFREQTRLAEFYSLPVIIHCVKRWNEIIQLKKTLEPTVPWIIHGFQKSVPLAVSLYQHGFYFSLGAALCKEETDWAGFFQNIPLERCLVETDDQLLWSAPQITRAMAQKSGVEEEKLRLLLHSNFQKIFHEFS